MSTRNEKKMRHYTLNYGQIIGLCTPSAGEISSSYDNVNLADGTLPKVQETVKQFIDYHSDLIGKPELSGLVEPNASLANERALEIARGKTGKSKVLCTNLSHNSIEDACKKLRLESIVLDVVPSLGFQVDQDDLAQKVSQHGEDLAAVVSTYGTTQLGHIEDLANREIVKQLREDGVWVHVDAAYGGVIGRLNKNVPRNANMFMGSCDRVEVSRELPDADSYTLDPYKFIGKVGCALLLLDKKDIPVRDIPHYPRSPFTLFSTVPFGPIVAWSNMVVELGLQEVADDCVYLARRSALDLHKAGISLTLPPQLGIVPITLKNVRDSSRVQEQLNSEGYIVGNLHIKGKGYTIHGIRFAVTPKTPEVNHVRNLTDKIISIVAPEQKLNVFRQLVDFGKKLRQVCVRG